MSCSSGGQHLSTATEARDFSHYLRALFPYATQQQLNELGHEDRTQEEAERHGYAALNPDVMSASFATYQLNENRAKVRRDADVFSGVAAHLLHRNAALQRRAKLRRLSGWEDFNANVGAFVVDTSRWDEVVLQPCASASTCAHQALPLRTESVVGGLASSPSPLPLGRWILCVEASLRASARLFVAHDVFPAPIMRWAPRVSGILFAERTILSAHDTSTSSMEDLSMPPHLLEASSGSSPTPIRLNRLHNDDDEDDDDGSFITADLLRPQVEPISAVEVGWGCPSMPATSFSTYSPNQHIIAPDYLAALAERKSYWSRVLMKMQSFVHAIRRANDVSASTKHDVVAFINRYCPSMVDRAPLLLERLLPVCARALTGSVVLPYVDEQRISFFGHKRLSCGPITIGALTFDVPRCTYAPTDDKEKLAVRLVASCVELMEIDFAYLSEAKAEKWEAVLRETGDEEMAQSGYSCDATRGKLYVGAKDVVICGELVLKLWATGSLQLCLQKAKVTVGSMSISTNVCHLRPLLWLTSCIIKSSLETSAQQALREISLEMS